LPVKRFPIKTTFRETVGLAFITDPGVSSDM
jgi:hypothetical protein